jgi:hypothetical protein
MMALWGFHCRETLTVTLWVRRPTEAFTKERVFVKGDIPMRLTPPKTIVWWISLLLVVLALLAFFIASLGFQYYALWLALASAVLMLLATLLKGL